MLCSQCSQALYPLRAKQYQLVRSGRIPSLTICDSFRFREPYGRSTSFNSIIPGIQAIPHVTEPTSLNSKTVLVRWISAFSAEVGHAISQLKVSLLTYQSATR